MVLIISHDEMDTPTNMVLDWFRFFNFKNYLRINGAEFMFDNEFTIDVNNKFIKSKKNTVDLTKVKSIFYRRWNSSVDETPLYGEYVKNNYSVSDVRLVKDFAYHFSSEYQNYLKSIFALQQVEDKNWIPKFKTVRELNKIEILNLAIKNGVDIPKTIITSKKSDLILFFNEHKDIITKPIGEVSFIEYEGIQVEMLTKKVTQKHIDKLPNQFFPTLFQSMVKKEFELRVFYLEGIFYSMAIFSQNDETTQLDFRNYNVQKPNRYVPFNLPKEIEEKLHLLMKDIGFNTGSIDMVIDNEGHYVFLEINPVGQLGMVSENCNYNLEKLIAQSLIKKENEN